MSSSESMPSHPITAWSLDELEMPHIFEVPLSRTVAAHAEHDEAPVEQEQLASPQERARIEAAAYAHGRADGERIARGELMPHLESTLSALNAVMEDVHLHQARWTSNAEENLAVLAVAIARQLIAKEVKADPSIISSLVASALSQFPLDQTITVRLNPDDVESCTTLLQNSTVRLPEVRWAADAHVHRGGALVEGRERIIDGRVDTALERIYRAIGNVQA